MEKKRILLSFEFLFLSFSNKDVMRQICISSFSYYIIVNTVVVFHPKEKYDELENFAIFLSNMDFSTSWEAISLRHFSMHGACLGSDSLFVLSPILAIACVSLGLSGIFDVRIIQQVLKSEMWHTFQWHALGVKYLYFGAKLQALCNIHCIDFKTHEGKCESRMNHYDKIKAKKFQT